MSEKIDHDHHKQCASAPANFPLSKDFPVVAPSSTFPSASTIIGFIPKMASWLTLALDPLPQEGSMRDKGTVSVCHQVSTIGHLPSPTTVMYQSQASGFIGSPTDFKNTQGIYDLYLQGPHPLSSMLLKQWGAV